MKAYHSSTRLPMACLVVFAWLASLPSVGTDHKGNSQDYWTPIISENLSDVDDLSLAWLAQLGSEWVVLNVTEFVDADDSNDWSREEIEAVQNRCREFGLELYSMMIPLEWLVSPMLEKTRPGRMDRGYMPDHSSRRRAGRANARVALVTGFQMGRRCGLLSARRARRCYLQGL